MEMIQSNGNFRMTRTAPVAYLKPSKAIRYANAMACEITIQVGIFFDGTGNSLYLHKSKKSHSNVARLYEAYPHLPEQGSHAIYIPGLGKPFVLINETTESILGSAFAQGGDARILVALLRVFNALHQGLFGTEFFSAGMISALCASSPSKADKTLLRSVGLDDSLVADDGARRSTFLSGCANSLRAKMKLNRSAKVCECVLDIFGFSRGATQARVFCHWLNDMVSQSGLADIPCRFRFLGLLDTVASVGIWEGIKNDQVRSTGGHANWATPKSMRILPNVENCVHLIAVHELRKNFPLDTIQLNRDLPPNCLEFAYPGSHSDVGGGYEPGELGVSAEDSLKLSQIPLNHLYDCALAAGVPLSKGRSAADFAIHSDLLAAFQQFIDISTEASRSLNDWMLPYLVWRWQVRKEFEKTGQVRKANPDHRRHLIASNLQFCYADEAIQMNPNLPLNTWRKKRPYDRDGIQAAGIAFEPEAHELRARVVAQPKISPLLAKFFDNFVHDSLAGFRAQLVEPTGYWRYRRLFRGSEIPFTG